MNAYLKVGQRVSWARRGVTMYYRVSAITGSAVEIVNATGRYLVDGDKVRPVALPVSI